MKAETDYDIAIAGGGLAGLTLAIQAADAGYKTVLFEKERYPYHKVCGEYISLESLPFLKRLGFNDNAYELPVINKLQLSDVKGKLYSFDLPLGGFGISRYTLDNALYDIATKKGVHVLQNTKVQNLSFANEKFTAESNAGNLTAKVAAATYGKRSNLDIKWNRSFTQKKPDKLNNYIGVKYHIRYAFPRQNIALHNFSNGYCGISTIEDGKCCLCYLTTAGNLKQHGNSIKQMEQQVLWQNPLLQHIFTKATFLYQEPLVISQVSFNKKEQVENNVLMIGDAAGLITPLCGNGMSMAMHASKLAFDNINRFLHGSISRKEMEDHYTKQWQQQFSRRLGMGRFVQSIFGNNTATSLFLTTMNHTPWLARKIISTTHGNAF
ncbi:NAD(P)/FAD-dependent oxidoreductase [Panacibacter sp. DH6]|uniref:NAD(P)/FAD-dependent oxidoreductase n=1 Tax=Panacibacter microcysteis TaxID=2793269 RepID=A0A931E900_9BACT|nr:NAD(P)/FAD-dependent oxidoreductase [Panacibacter microcysteis]MBG9377571.1 NAD(P)/FAD-dependent oxidoreductase [Panacibacter microcysteis]